MTDLETIISTLSIEDHQRFVQFLHKKNKRHDAKNVMLFKLLAKNELDSTSICKKIYNSKTHNAYHALRKRLYQSLIDFSANTSIEEENSLDIQLIKYIIVSRSFLHNAHYKVAYKLLDKAEAIAKEHFMFSILNEIYHTKIQYAYAIPNINLEQLIIDHNTNKKNHLLEDQLNIVYAKMKQTLTAITIKGDVIDFEALLNKTLKEHSINNTDLLSFKSLYQLMTIVSISAFVTNDYLKTEPFLISTYAKLNAQPKHQKQVFYHIQVLYLIANTLFRNKKFEQSLTYLKHMYELMLENKRKHYNPFILKHALLLALNKNYTNHQDEAITILEPLLNKKQNDLETLLNIKLGLVMIYIQAKDYKKAYRLFSKFYHTNAYYESKAGKEWTIKKNLIEIILHVELENIDLVESRLLSFRRNYSKYIKSINQERVLIYLTFVESYYKNPESITTDTIKQKIEDSFVWIDANKEDIFVMSFYAWLKSKLENKPLYKTTLDLVESAITC